MMNEGKEEVRGRGETRELTVKESKMRMERKEEKKGQ